ncbi:MAG: reverse transcriptase family protein, partial [Candidatus Thiodiazotropha sp.]
MPPTMDKGGNHIIRRNLQIVQWNANGILRELPLLEDYLERHRVDIACVQETKLLPRDQTPHLKQFTAVRQDRQIQGEARGGGLLIYVRKDIPYKVVQRHQQSNAAFEQLSLDIPTVTDPIRISNWYLPPANSPYLRRMEFVEQDLTFDITSNEIVCADLNAHDPTWDCIARSDERGELIAETIMDINGTILNDSQPTRQDPGTGKLSSPDITFTHETLMCKCDWTPGDFLSSDHRPILITIAIPAVKLKCEKRLVWDWKNGNMEHFTRRVDEIVAGSEWEEMKNAKILYDTICTAILQAARTHIGMKAIGMAGECWRTKEIDQMEKQRDLLRETEGIQSANYQQTDAELKAAVKDRKKEIWHRQIVTKQGTHKMWSLYRSLTATSRPDTMKIITDDGQDYVSSRQKANAFARAYQTVSTIKLTKEDRNIKKLLNKNLRQDYLVTEADQLFTVQEVKSAINGLNPAKSPGPDNIHPRFLHHLGPISLTALTKMYNISWLQTQIPQEWRVADIRPIPKAGKDANKLDSYRPISLTSTVGKVMERLVTNRLRYITESEKLLSENQAGFRHGRSTEDQLIRLSQSISDGFQSTPMKRTVLALLDYSKAYDRVWRDALLLKLNHKGVPAHMIRWIQAWLANRKNWVTFHGASS